VNVRLLSAIVFGVALSAAATAQDASTDRETGQSRDQAQSGGRQDLMGPGRAMPGIVIRVNEDQFTVRTGTGKTYTVYLDLKTHIFKGPGHHVGPMRPGGDPAVLIKPGDVNVGDAIVVQGETDPATKSIYATLIREIDPEPILLLSEQRENFGKTWLTGQVQAVADARITLMGSLDHVPHTIVTGESTTFRKQQVRVALADLKRGDNVRVEGAVKGGVFVATYVYTVVPQPTTAPRTTPPPASYQ
jgi:hypothetical protein